MIPYRRRGRAIVWRRGRSKLLQNICLGTIGLTIAAQPIAPWFWGTLAALATGIWIRHAWKELQEEDTLHNAIKERMEHHEHWPEPPSDDSGFNPYGEDRLMGTWNECLCVSLQVHTEYVSKPT